MTGPVRIGDRLIAEGQPCYVIAEIGVNHNGDPELAHALIDAARAAGADAVKLQTFTPDALAASDAPKAEYQQRGDRSRSQRDMLARLTLDEAAHVELMRHAEASGIALLSSPFDESAVELLERLGIPAFKVPSGEVTNHRMLRRIAAIGRPVLMSTGMCTLEEVEQAVAALQSAPASPPLVLLHCVSSYPTEPRDCNLRAMEVLRARFDVPVGWSDHTEGSAVTIAAVALGARVIEKHVTLCRALPGPDHRCSLEPDELREMIAAIRSAELALGESRKQPVAAELAIAAVARKSLHWRSELAVGTLVSEADLVALRPGTGISPARSAELSGRRVRRAVKAGSRVQMEDLE